MDIGIWLLRKCVCPNCSHEPRYVSWSVISHLYLSPNITLFWWLETSIVLLIVATLVVMFSACLSFMSCFICIQFSKNHFSNSIQQCYFNYELRCNDCYTSLEINILLSIPIQHDIWASRKLCIQKNVQHRFKHMERSLFHNYVTMNTKFLCRSWVLSWWEITSEISPVMSFDSRI